MDSLPQPHGQPAPFVFASPEQASESGFDFWGVLNRRKWLVFLGLISGMALGTLYDSQCETIYKSEAKVKIEPKDPLYLQMSQGSMMMLPGAADMTIRHDQMIGQFNIVSDCLVKNELLDLECFGKKGELSDDDKYIEVINSLNVTQNKEEPILYEMVYYSSRPEDSQTILNHLIDTYEMNLDAQYTEESDKVSTLLKSIESEFEGNYVTLQKRLDEAHKENQAVIVSMGNLTLHQVKVGELEKILQRDQGLIQDLSLDLERAQLGLDGNLEEIESTVWIFKEQGKITDDGQRPEIRNSDIRLIESKLRELQGEYRRMIGTFGPGHKQVKILKQDIEVWEKSLADALAEGEINRALPIEPEEVLRRFVDSLNQQISDLQMSIATDQKALVEHSIEAARIANVQRKIEVIESQMDDAREFIQIANRKLVEVDAGDNNARQEGFRFQTLQSASYGEPVWPILFVILGIGGLLGSVAGFGLGCLVELADKTFHNPDEIMKQLNVPLIGHIPVIGQSKRYRVENSLIEPIICTYHRPKSQVSEAFRAVRTSLYFNTQGKNHAVIQVTSPTPGDGKSTLASNLAVSIAQSGKRILLVDADMRRPRQHSTFGISSKEGFASVLSGQSQWRDVMYECHEIEGLTVMPCGAKPNNPAELSSSPQVKMLIEEMREEFDFVIIDTPPLLAVTDPCPIAARVDGVILCLRIKKNVRVSAERSTEMLANLGAKCIGLVVNGVGAQSGYGSQYTYGAYRAGYSYNGYGYGYGYGTGGKYYEEDQKGRKAGPVPKHIEDLSTHSSEQPPVA